MSMKRTKSWLGGLLVLVSSFGFAACDTPLELPPAMAEAKLLLLGEMHGTQESPALVGRLVCGLAQRDKRPLVLGLEIPPSEQQAIDAFVSGGSESAFAEHRATSAYFWARKIQDGRSSQAMLDLIRAVRKLRVESRAEIAVLAFDGERKDRSDQAMAQLVRARLLNEGDARFVLLTGNTHAATSRGTSWDADFEPLGFLLADFKPLSLNMTSSGGTAWICSGGRAETLVCRAQPNGSDDAAVFLPQPRFVIGQGFARNFDGYVDIGRSSASPPALAGRQIQPTATLSEKP